MRGHKTIVTPELEEKVVRCYVEKNMSLNMIADLGICDQNHGSEILKKHGVILKKEAIKFGKRNRGKIPWDSPPQ